METIYHSSDGFLALSPVHTMNLLSATQCCRQKFHGVYVRETSFKRFLEFHETVSSNRTLLYILKLVCNFLQVYDYQPITAPLFLRSVYL